MHLLVFAAAVLSSLAGASAARGTDDCEYANNGFCDDAGLWKMFYDKVVVREIGEGGERGMMEAASNMCPTNTDVSDCGVHVLCDNSCSSARNGVCDVDCDVGTDCEDCGASLIPSRGGDLGPSDILMDLMMHGRASTCDDSCDFANNGVCDYSHTWRDPWLLEEDDQGAWTTCKPGTDFSDCGVVVECSNTCEFANDGVCDETAGGGGRCGLGTDCNDCGPYLNVNSPYTPRGEEEEDSLAGVLYSGSCDDSCPMANNGVCEYLMWEWEDDYETWFTNVGDSWCAWGTDCTDCENMFWPDELPAVKSEHFLPSENNLLCTDTCLSSSDGVCDYRPKYSSGNENFVATASRADYSPGVDLVCDWGTDCSDCQSWYVGFLEIGITIEDEQVEQNSTGDDLAITETNSVWWDLTFMSTYFSSEADEEDTDEFPNEATFLNTVWSIVESLVPSLDTSTRSSKSNRMSYEQEMLASA